MGAKPKWDRLHHQQITVLFIGLLSSCIHLLLSDIDLHFHTQ